MLYAIVALLVIVLDQWTKLWVATNKDMFPRPLIDGFISLVTAQNKGIAFGLFGGQTGSVEGKTATVIFIAVAGAVALLAIILLATNLVKGGLGRWSLVFISAGGLSNAIDRIMSQGNVQDMIKLDFLQKFRVNFPIFNVADIFITVFSFLLILYILFGGNKKAAREDGEDEYEEDEEEEEEDDEEEEDEPVRRKGKKAARKSAPAPAPAEDKPARTRGSYEEDYQRYKAKKAREEKPAPAPAPAPVVDPGDPFAEWEAAQKKAAAEKAAAAPKAKPVAKPAPAPAKPAAAPAPKAKPAAKPAPAPAKPAEEEYSLEDILAEFK